MRQTCRSCELVIITDFSVSLLNGISISQSLRLSIKDGILEFFLVLVLSNFKILF